MAASSACAKTNPSNGWLSLGLFVAAGCSGSGTPPEAKGPPAPSASVAILGAPQFAGRWLHNAHVPPIREASGSWIAFIGGRRARVEADKITYASDEPVPLTELISIPVDGKGWLGATATSIWRLDDPLGAPKLLVDLGQPIRELSWSPQGVFVQLNRGALIVDMEKGTTQPATLNGSIPLSHLSFSSPTDGKAWAEVLGLMETKDGGVGWKIGRGLHSWEYERPNVPPNAPAAVAWSNAHGDPLHAAARGGELISDDLAMVAIEGGVATVRISDGSVVEQRNEPSWCWVTRPPKADSPIAFCENHMVMFEGGHLVEHATPTGSPRVSADGGVLWDEACERRTSSSALREHAYCVRQPDGTFATIEAPATTTTVLPRPDGAIVIATTPEDQKSTIARIGKDGSRIDLGVAPAWNQIMLDAGPERDLWVNARTGESSWQVTRISPSGTKSELIEARCLDIYGGRFVISRSDAVSVRSGADSREKIAWSARPDDKVCGEASALGFTYGDAARLGWTWTDNPPAPPPKPAPPNIQTPTLRCSDAGALTEPKAKLPSECEKERNKRRGWSDSRGASMCMTTKSVKIVAFDLEVPGQSKTIDLGVPPVEIRKDLVGDSPATPLLEAWDWQGGWFAGKIQAAGKNWLVRAKGTQHEWASDKKLSADTPFSIANDGTLLFHSHEGGVSVWPSRGEKETVFWKPFGSSDFIAVPDGAVAVASGELAGAVGTWRVGAKTTLAVADFRAEPRLSQASVRKARVCKSADLGLTVRLPLDFKVEATSVVYGQPMSFGGDEGSSEKIRTADVILTKEDLCIRRVHAAFMFAIDADLATGNAISVDAYGVSQRKLTCTWSAPSP